MTFLIKRGLTMEKSTKKYTKLLIITIAAIALLSLGVNIAMRLTSIGDSIGGVRSGIFVGATQSSTRYGFNFSAQEASGHIIFFTNLNKENMGNIRLVSSLTNGELHLTVTQGGFNQEHDLSGTSISMMPEDFDMGFIGPGRVEFRLDLTDAENVEVTVSWG